MIEVAVDGLATGRGMTNLTTISLGAGVQSTTMALLACEGTLPKPDVAIFADTGWEPRRVYEHLDRLEVELERAGIPLYRVGKGDLRNDAIDPVHRYASIPYFVRNPPFEVREATAWETCPLCKGASRDAAVDDCTVCRRTGLVATKWRMRPATLTEREGMGRRQCTSEYKLGPIKRKVRELLGAKPPNFRHVRKGRVAEQWIGFSTDEIGRVSDKDGVLYLKSRYPLLDLGMSRKDCERWLKVHGWPSVAKSACIGCPYHGNRQWRDLRDNAPAEWADAVEFDQAIRKGGARGLPLNGEAFLHRSRLPLDQAPIERVTRSEWAERQTNLFDALADIEAGVEEDGDPDGCSPYGCRSGASTDVTDLGMPGRGVA